MDLKLRKRRVVAATASGPRMVHRLRTALGRELLATPEHLLLTVNGWQPLGSLRPGDHIAAPRASEMAAVDWDRVVSVEPVGMRETYDLTVESDHNFVANDLIAHNSHAASFALLAYASAYLKAHHPPAFYAALLNNQPMGFYDPATIIGDAGRHGQGIRPADVNFSGWLCAIEPDGVVRLGLRYVRGLREEAGRRIEQIAEAPGAARFRSIDDLVARAALRQDEARTLAEIGALAPFGGDRRTALWQAARLPDCPIVDSRSPIADSRSLIADRQSPMSPLPSMSLVDRVQADYDGTGLTIGPHPMALARASLATRGILRASDLPRGRAGRRVRVAGAVITRQRPGTAKGFVFLSLEDETGIANIIVNPDVFARDKRTIVDEPYLVVEGTLQNQDGAVSVKADRIDALGHAGPKPSSHDFY